MAVEPNGNRNGLKCSWQLLMNENCKEHKTNSFFLLLVIGLPITTQLRVRTTELIVVHIH